MFEGGFIGVDIFFVISGYLITSIIVEDCENKKFNLLNFYERRVRRILPALIFIAISCIPFAWLWMLPSQMKDFSQSLIALTMFITNILFWKETDYFALSADEKPLLHTWSLSVEEQFYIIFPLIIFFFWKFGRNKVFIIIFLLAIISFFACEWGWRNNNNANFYLLPFRAWELLIGSICAFIKIGDLKLRDNLLSLLGFFLIVFGIFYYSETTPFPSFYSLVPIIGVSLVILFAKKNTFLAKFLSKKILVSIGLSSYSAYLLHQPLFAFARVRLIGEPSYFVMFLLSISSLVFARILWSYVEIPFRNRSLYSRSVVFSLVLFSFLFLITFGVLGHKSEGFPSRSAGNHLPHDFFEYAYIDKAVNSSKCINSKNYICNLNKPFTESRKYLLLGDSHSVDFQRNFIEYSKKNSITADQFSITGCSFIRVNEANCKITIEKLKEISKTQKYDKIILISNLYKLAYIGISDQEWELYEELLIYISNYSKDLHIFVPRLNIATANPIKNIVFKKENLNKINLFGVENLVNDFYKNLANITNNIKLYDQSSFILNLGGGYENFNSKTELGYPIYRDTNHLTRYATKVIFENFIETN